MDCIPGAFINAMFLAFRYNKIIKYEFIYIMFKRKNNWDTYISLTASSFQILHQYQYRKSKLKTNSYYRNILCNIFRTHHLLSPPFQEVPRWDIMVLHHHLKLRFQDNTYYSMDF